MAGLQLSSKSRAPVGTQIVIEERIIPLIKTEPDR